MGNIILILEIRDLKLRELLMFKPGSEYRLSSFSSGFFHNTRSGIGPGK
jgi:hypothetical protein